MNRLHTRALAILTAGLVAFLMGGSWAWAGEGNGNCTTETTGWVTSSPGNDWVQVDQRTVVDQEAWDETVIDQEAVPAQHYSLKGNSGIGKDEVPVFPADYWQANTTQEPHYAGNATPAQNVDGTPYVDGQSGLHYTSHGSEGLRDWFYFQAAVPEVSHVVHHEAVTHEEYKFAKTTCVDQPNPEVTTTTEQQVSCDSGVEERTITTTTQYAWVDGEWVLDPDTAVVEVGDWTFVRDLTKAEQEEYGCGVEPPVVNPPNPLASAHGKCGVLTASATNALEAKGVAQEDAFFRIVKNGHLVTDKVWLAAGESYKVRYPVGLGRDHTIEVFYGDESLAKAHSGKGCAPKEPPVKPHHPESTPPVETPPMLPHTGGSNPLPYLLTALLLLAAGGALMRVARR